MMDLIWQGVEMGLGPVGGSWDGNRVVGEREGGVGGSVGSVSKSGCSNWKKLVKKLDCNRFFCNWQLQFSLSEIKKLQKPNKTEQKKTGCNWLKRLQYRSCKCAYFTVLFRQVGHVTISHQNSVCQLELALFDNESRYLTGNYTRRCGKSDRLSLLTTEHIFDCMCIAKSVRR